MNPRRLVSTLLEADEFDQPPIDSGGEDFGTDEIKDFVDSEAKDPAQKQEGIPIRGYYRQLEQKLSNARTRNGDKSKKVDRNTWLIQYEDGVIGVRLHDTDIIRITPDDTLTINTGGWETKTTYARIEDWLPGGWRTYSLKGSRYWWNYKTDRGSGHEDPSLLVNGHKAIQPVSSGDTIDADGTLNPRLPVEYVRVPKRRGTNSAIV